MPPQAASHDGRRLRTIGRYVLVYGLGLLFVLFSILPLLWGVSTALKVPSEVYAFPPTWIPKTITFENFIAVFHNPIADPQPSSTPCSSPARRRSLP